MVGDYWTKHYMLKCIEGLFLKTKRPESLEKHHDILCKNFYIGREWNRNDIIYFNKLHKASIAFSLKNKQFHFVLFPAPSGAMRQDTNHHLFTQHTLNQLRNIKNTPFYDA